MSCIFEEGILQIRASIDYSLHYVKVDKSRKSIYIYVMSTLDEL